MKRFLMNLMLLVAVLFTSACAKEQAVGQNTPSVQNVKAVDSKKNTFASTYLTNIDKDAEMYVADFDFNQYLLDSGAINIQRLDNIQDSETLIAARYPNGIVTVYEFSSDRNDPWSYGFLVSINVFVAEEDYDVNGRYTGLVPEEDMGICSEWSHYFYVNGTAEIVNDLKFEEDYSNNGKYGFFTVKPNGIYYVEAKNGQKSLLVVPDFIDLGFKASILPYISMKDPSFRKDSMEGKLRGISD